MFYVFVLIGYFDVLDYYNWVNKFYFNKCGEGYEVWRFNCNKLYRIFSLVF